MDVEQGAGRPRTCRASTLELLSHPIWHDVVMSRALVRSTLLDSGVLRTSIDHALRAKHWERQHNGIYLNTMLDGQQRWMAQLDGHIIRGGPGSAASHRAAAVLWKMDGVTGFPLDVTVGFDSGFKRPPAIRSRTLTSADVTWVGGVAVTNKARTLCDLGRFESDRVVEQALESVLRGPDRRRPFEWNEELLAELHRRVSTDTRSRGIATLRRVLVRRADRNRPTGSFAETVAVQALALAGIAVICQPTLAITRTATFFPDIAVPSRGLLIEIDGRAGHEGEDARARDLPRQNLFLRGFDLMRFTARAALADAAGLAEQVRHRVRELPARGDSWEVNATKVSRTAEGWIVS